MEGVAHPSPSAAFLNFLELYQVLIHGWVDRGSLPFTMIFAPVGIRTLSGTSTNALPLNYIPSTAFGVLNFKGSTVI